MPNRDSFPPLPPTPKAGPEVSVGQMGSLDHGYPVGSRSQGELPANSADVDSKPVKKRVNPLVDLIETEKTYVDVLAIIIRRVASAWSRTNFPPRELDTMFRAIESVYRANRALLSKLKEIGPHPSSPKALGDLLMRWIDDLEPPYSKYSDGYVVGFDIWEPVQSNPNLASILDDISASIPPSTYNSSARDTWTLDSLFLTPATRINYYRKLYARLLKSTQPGRSDHSLLLGANERLARLLDVIDSRSFIQVGAENISIEDTLASQPNGNVPSPPSLEPASRPPRKSVDSADFVSPLHPRGVAELRLHTDALRTSDNGSTTGSSSSGRMSRDTEGNGSRESAMTSDTSARARRLSSSTLSAPITDLERRLSTERVLDIFTMAPKKCRLQMSPPNLSFTRRIRFSTDVAIHFTPRSTGIEVIHNNAHIFLLTDLFLVCERMTEAERRAEGYEGFDMWLCYPPLSAKHLTATDGAPGEPENVLHVHIMKKETLTVRVESRQVKDAILKDFNESQQEAVMLNPLRPKPSMGNLNVGPAPSSQTPSFPPPHPPQHEFPAPNGSVQHPPRARTQSPPRVPPKLSPTGDSSDRPSFGLDDPPRPQFGRLAAGSDPNLPGSMGLPRGESSTSRVHSSEAPLFLPPPRGASRVHTINDPPGNRPPPNNPIRQGHPEGQFFTSHSEMERPPSNASGFLQNSGAFQSNSPVRQESLHANQFPPPRRLSKSSSTQSFQRPSYDTRTDIPSLHPNNVYNDRPPVGSSSWNGPPHPTHNLGPNGVGHRPDPRPTGPPASLRSFDSNSIQSHAPSLASSVSRPPRLQMGVGFVSRPQSPDLDSPPTSPDEDKKPTVPVTSVITAQMKCKVFLKQHHAQWKSLGPAKLLLYQQQPTNVKQLVVEADTKAKSMLISTIVLTDAVERVGKTGVAIELSDEGQRTGIVYMIQLKSEASASGFFGTLLAGSDRAHSAGV